MVSIFVEQARWKATGPIGHFKQSQIFDGVKLGLKLPEQKLFLENRLASDVLRTCVDLGLYISEADLPVTVFGSSALWVYPWH